MRHHLEEAAMPPRSPGERQPNERAANSMVVIATVWAAVILYFALRSVLN